MWRATERKFCELSRGIFKNRVKVKPNAISIGECFIPPVIFSIFNDQADIMIDIFTDDPDNQTFYFTNPIFNAPYTLISTYQDQPTDNDIDVALPSTSPTLFTYLQQEFPKWEIRQTSPNVQDSLDLVSNRQADMALIDNINLEMDRPLILYPNLAIIPGLSIKVPVSVAISTKQPRILQSILNKAIIQLNPQVTDQIIQKHTTISSRN